MVEHFDHVLNIYTPCRPVSQAIIDSFPCCYTHDGMANNIPNMDEVQTVLCHIAGNKVAW